MPPIKESKLRAMIRTELKKRFLQENEEKLSNADFTKGLKSGASDLASLIPTALNNDFVDAMKKLAAAAKFDKAKFQKLKGLIDTNTKNATEKQAQKSQTETPEEEK
jgi:hypothetical protein